VTAAWLTGNMLAFDTETTGPDPLTARIVTAHAVECGPGGALVRGSWLVNPEMPIPPEATAIHKVTDEMAAGGIPRSTAHVEIANVLLGAAARGIPIVAMNASYDLTVLNAGLTPLDQWRPPEDPLPAILDPHVIDRGLNPFRKGKRQLLDLAKSYKVRLGEAHSADGDALMAARIVWAMAQNCKDIQHLTLDEMQGWQQATHRKWALQYRNHLRSQGKPSDVDDSWPIRKPTQTEERSAA